MRAECPAWWRELVGSQEMSAVWRKGGPREVVWDADETHPDEVLLSCGAQYTFGGWLTG